MLGMHSFSVTMPHLACCNAFALLTVGFVNRWSEVQFSHPAPIKMGTS
jgi:hypothetical protein